MAKKFRTDDIPGFDENWNGASTNSTPTASDESNLLPYSGKAVRTFLQKHLKSHDEKKLGYCPALDKVDGFWHQRFFASKDTYELWHSDPATYQDLQLLDVTIPISDEQGVMNIVELKTSSNQTNLVSIDGSVILQMRFTSQTYNPILGTKTDTYEDGVISIYRRTSSTDSWRKLGELPIKSVPADGIQYVPVDISSMLNPGSCQLRVVVTGDQSKASTTYIVFQNVVKTTLSLEFRNEWQTPITSANMPLLYTYTGDVAKSLNLRITGQGGTRIMKFSLGTQVYTETPNQFDISDTAADTVKVMSHGVHEIEAWLSVDGVEGTESEHVFSQVMVVSDTTDTNPYLILNKVATSLTNWTSATLFEWAIYNPVATATIPIRFTLTNLDGSTTYLELVQDNVESGKVYSFANMIEIESTAPTFSTYMHFHTGSTELRDKISFSVDNTQNFAPIGGADFIFNPKLRSNTESNPATVINTVSGATVPATFKNFGFVSDGWVTDENGIRCFRVPSGRELNIDYEAFTAFKGDDQTAKTGSLTIEIDFKVRAISDEAPAIFRMCSYTDAGNPLGWEMRPLEACFMTQNKVARTNQGIGYQEDERTKVAINFLYNLSGTGQNYCRIFVNGVLNREFNYQSTDVFVQYVNGVETSQGIRIGSETAGADIDIYSIKVYKKAMTSADILQNFIASLDSSEAKVLFRDANDILSGSTISYDKAYDKYNVIKWIGQYATYGNTKKDSFPGTLVIHQPGLPEYSGTITNMEESGQGTSSMLYFVWNGQWKEVKDSDGNTIKSQWIDENGNDRGRGFMVAPDVPQARKLVGKVNFASSMQSHKIGATGLYDALWKAVCGGSSITQTEGYENCRSAVIEKPFLFFIQKDENSEPEFYCFMTFGPGKGDKPTFGFDNDVFPDYLCLEGSDNDRDLVMGRVPWIDGDVTIEEGEKVMYRGQKQMELVGGDMSKLFYFQDAWNFIFQHFDDIDFHEGTLEDLLADTEVDTSKHYWMTQAGANNAQYDLYRYDFINNTWVDAGISKTSTGYAKQNINTQCGNIASGSNWELQNNRFKEVRLQLFKAKVGNYFDMTETMFTMNFLKLIAATDNRGKNQYFYVDPTTHLIGWHQDDLDSIFLTDNVGKMTKPYDVEEHDKTAEGNPYWNSEANSLFNQIENAFPDELRANMNTIFQEMAKMSSDGTVFGCFKDFFFSVQEYFPAVAYNEVARLVYERARTAYITPGGYQNGTDPITQSCGDSVQREMQWVRRRIAYLSSYASYGDFGRRDGEGAAGSLNFRSIVKRDESRPTYKFKIIPHISMYPTFALGSTLTYGEGVLRAPRIRAGETYEVTVGTSDGNTNIFLNGINYMRNIGDFTDKSLGETFNLTGDRLTEFVVSANQTVEFRPTAINVNTPLLQKLILKNVETLTGGLDLTNQTKLFELDVRGTKLTSVTLPATEYLKSIQLPATLRSLTLDEQPNLETVTLEGAASMQRLSLGEGVPNSRNIFNLCFTGGAPLNYLRMHGINWEDASLYMVNYLASITDSEVTGKITMPNNTANRPTFANKMSWLKHWGNVDDENNPLHITYYTTALASVSIRGEQFIYETGDHVFSVHPNNANANDVVAVRWELESNLYSTLVKQDGDSCTVNVHQLGDEDTIAPTTLLHCYVTKSNGNVLHAQWEIGLYPRRAHIGDYVFYDGTYGPTLAGKTVVGICFYINPLDPTDRRMVATNGLGSDHWGLYPDANNGVAGIKLPSDENYNVYDIPTIANITSSGLANGASHNSPSYIEPNNFLNEDSVDGFVEAGNNTGAADGIASPTNGRSGKSALSAELAILTGYRQSGEEVPNGQLKTLRIIQHRNKILEDVGLSIPEATESMTELAHLNNLITQVIEDNNNKNTFRQYYYPAASRCYAYQPGVTGTEVLNDKFKAHNWWLPSSGELARLYWHSKQGGAYPDDVRIGNIFKHGVDDGVFSDFPASGHWSSTEYSQYLSWFVYFDSGYFSGGSKYPSYVVRAVAAF